jgi:hypothetical protein
VFDSVSDDVEYRADLFTPWRCLFRSTEGLKPEVPTYDQYYDKL